MSIQLLVWLLAFVMQAALMGMCVYQLVQLTDLEADFINPHEAATNFNLIAYPDLFVQAIVTAMHFFTGHWSIVVLQLAVLAYNLNQYRAGRHVVDVTEIFRQVSKHKKSMYIKTGIYLLAFTWSMYRLVEALVRTLASPGSHAVAQTILKEAAATLHRK